MTIYSWNMFHRNKRPAEVLAFIRESGADVFCLQEVPEESLAEISALYPYHAEAIEMERLLPERPLATYSLTLSRHPIRASDYIELNDYQDRLPLRTRFFFLVMQPFGLSRIRKRNVVYADIESPQGLTRVINIHLTLSNPAWRMEEFEMAMLARDRTLPTIVCGDFNTLEHPRVTLINWLAGGRLSDIYRYKRERLLIEEHFVHYELHNALSGRRTHKISRSQLDHILVSKEFSVVDAGVSSERFGSDHHPVRVALERA